MSQKPIVMEQLKQILQLKDDGIGIREIARRTGICRNSVEKPRKLTPSPHGKLTLLRHGKLTPLRHSKLTP